MTDPGSSWGFFGDFFWPAIFAVLSAMSARITYLQNDKIKKIRDDVQGCIARDSDHASALAAHQLHTERVHPSKQDVRDALSAQTDRISEIMALHNGNVVHQLAVLSKSVEGMLARERNQRVGDSR